MPSSLAVLRDFMLQRYDDLKARLTRRLGCADMASDALQDTWLRLEGKDELGPVDSGRVPAADGGQCGGGPAARREPPAHLQRGRGLARLADPAPGPAQTAQGREELDTLVRVMGELSERQRGCCWPCGWKGCRRPRWRRAWVCRCAPWSANCAARTNTVRRASVIYCHHKNASPRRIPAARTVIGVARGITARRRSMPASPYREWS